MVSKLKVRYVCVEEKERASETKVVSYKAVEAPGMCTVHCSIGHAMHTAGQQEL